MKKMKKYRWRIWSKPLPFKFEDTQPQVHNPMEEVNLGTVEEMRITYISSLMPSDLKEEIIAIL